MAAIPVFPGNPRQKHEFEIRLDGFIVGWFEKATLPEIETEIDEFNPAGSVRPTKFAGRAKIGDCTLEKGVISDDGDFGAWNWFRQAVDTAYGTIGDPEDYRRDVEICETDHMGNVIQTYLLKDAFCSKISLSEFDGGSSEHVVETLTLTVNDMEVF